MKALVKQGKGKANVGLMDVQEPRAKSNEVKVKVHATGICGTDLHIIKDEYPSDYPVIMGHEYSGVVVEIGDDVHKFNAGDRVVSLTAIVTCGKCSYCREGLLMLCNQRKSIGSGVNGAFAEYIVIPEEAVYKIPDNVSLDEAALTEPLACMVRCVIERGTVNAGDNVLVSGPGAIGLLTMQVAKACGGNVVVLGTSKDKKRLELATKLGAIAALAVDEHDEKEILNYTNDLGFDVVFECSGVAASANTCLRLVKKSGLYVQVGLFGKTIDFDFDLALTKEVMITNGYASEPSSWTRALNLLKNKQVNVLLLISHKLPLDKWAEGVAIAEQKERLKILLQP